MEDRLYFLLKACLTAKTDLVLFSKSMSGEQKKCTRPNGEATNPGHGGGPDHFPPGFLGLPDLVVFVIKILKCRQGG